MLTKTQEAGPSLWDVSSIPRHHGLEDLSSLYPTYLFMMCFPTSVEPVNPIFLTSG